MFLDFLDRFFLYKDFGKEFYLWSIDHLLATVIFALLPIAVILIFKNKIRNLKHEPLIGLFMGILGLLIEFIQYYWHYHGGQTDWRHIYPTTLCGLTLYISSIAMISRNDTLAKIAYFYSYGAFFSFLFADISHGYDRFRFYAFFIIHGLILCNAVYMIAVRRIRADKQGLRSACLLLVPVLAASFALNYFFSDDSLLMNFFYVSYPPFEFPVFSPLYEANPLVFSLVVCICYFLLNLIMYGIAKILKFDKTR
ncbi:MAG: TMEM164-related integral membrane acyltransferase [Saccharofermentanales bacterium]